MDTALLTFTDGRTAEEIEIPSMLFLQVEDYILGMVLAYPPGTTIKFGDHGTWKMDRFWGCPSCMMIKDGNGKDTPNGLPPAKPFKAGPKWKSKWKNLRSKINCQ